ncbi:protein kinase [Streptomyces sp. SID8374]|uniref:serine/threonine-protein kinase n=1 Tax=unclassified Streptomyces TaxID=2593676 RepID=UPI00081F4D03|nr:serine/threonine-protein kinase [Streptomyces sp. ScaeMP-e83]MYR95849.1 protein kinase [Streptomyces sp. SID4937]MYX14167.1 protein kinase [Streptomyces sp. SID8374]SCD98401.1 Serine/threonine protein kinase [Streptomyces sp. ScaeMP-e83]
MSNRVIAGRYELATILGQGGMGQVWTAYDQRLDRRVAVKLLRPDRVAGPTGSDAADELRRRFVRECRVTAQVDHPGLVTVHDAGSDGDDLFLVMQYVEGADLADHLAEQDPYPWPWAVAVAAQLCAVLCAVHAVPIVHRDLKPRNVMVRPDGSVTVLDLGVASVLDTDTTRLTHTGSPIGSPAYMAPEQAMGGAVGPYTDLYALGVVLHEMLSGDVPFAGSTALGVLHRHLYEPPVPVRQGRSEVPVALEALVLRLLAKDPQDRPASAQEVYEELAPLLPKHGTPAGPLDPTRPFLRPHAPWPDRAATPATSPVPPSVSVPSQAQAGTTPWPAVASLLSPPPPLTAPTSFTPPPARPDVAQAVDEVKKLLGEGRITQAVDILGAILPAAAAEHGEHSPVVRILRKQYAATLMDDGQFRRALPELRRLAEDRTAEAGPADAQVLQFRYDAAQCLEQLGEATAALGEYRAVLPYYENAYGAVTTDPGRALDIRHRIGQLLLAVGDHTAGRAQLQALLYDAERTYGPHHPLPVDLRRRLSHQSDVRGG